MNLKKELIFRDFVQRENNFLHAPYDPELEFYSAIKSGNTTKVKELCKEYSVSEPFLRYRIKNGMSLEQALTTPKLTDGRPRKE